MEMSQQEYQHKLAQVADCAIRFAKTGNGYSEMRTAFNELCQEAGANEGINAEATIGRRKLMGQAINIKCIAHLNKEQLRMLDGQFNGLAEDIGHLNFNRRPARRR